MLPSGSEKLYTASRDGYIRVWDCHSGQCDGVVNLRGEIGSLISAGPWVFAGIKDVVKVRLKHILFLFSSICLFNSV